MFINVVSCPEGLKALAKEACKPVDECLGVGMCWVDSRLQFLKIHCALEEAPPAQFFESGCRAKLFSVRLKN